MGFALFFGFCKMRTIFTIILLNLVLIPAFWLLPSTFKVHFYTVAAIIDAFLYLALTVLFFFEFRKRKQEEHPGLTLRFILLQLILLFSLFLFNLSGLLLLKYC